MDKEALDLMTALGTVGAAIVAAIGLFVALNLGNRQLKTALDLHREVSNREKQRVSEARVSLATVLFVEIHNRASRCLLDGITWASKHVDGKAASRRNDGPKFRPFPPAAYRALADRLTELPADAAHRVVRFYNALKAIDRKIVFLERNPEAKFEHRTAFVASEYTTENENRLVAARFHQTFLPALEALESLRPLLEAPEELEKSLFEADRQYLADPLVAEAFVNFEIGILRNALKVRFEWFQRHGRLAKYVNYTGEE